MPSRFCSNAMNDYFSIDYIHPWNEVLMHACNEALRGRTIKRMNQRQKLQWGIQERKSAGTNVKKNLTKWR